MESTSFKDAVRINFDGTLKSDDLDFLNSSADDEAWKELNLKCGDLFAVTKENLFLKAKALEKYKSSVNLITNKLKIKNKIMENKSGEKHNTAWSDAELALIWSASVPEVAETLNRTPAAVTYQRWQFRKENPNFIPPKEAGRKSGGVSKALRDFKDQQKINSINANTVPQPIITKDEVEVIEQAAISTVKKVELPKEKSELINALQLELEALNYKVIRIKELIEIYKG